jgi:hypothetical protein
MFHLVKKSICKSVIFYLKKNMPDNETYSSILFLSIVIGKVVQTCSFIVFSGNLISKSIEQCSISSDPPVEASRPVESRKACATVMASSPSQGSI